MRFEIMGFMLAAELIHRQIHPGLDPYARLGVAVVKSIQYQKQDK